MSLIQVIFTSEAKRVLYRKGADIPVDGQLNEGTWILIQICFVDQHGVGKSLQKQEHTPLSPSGAIYAFQRSFL